MCSYCKRYKPFCDFGTNGNSKLKSRCKECQSKYNTNYHKNTFRFDRYGITKEQFDKLLNDQNNKCAICKVEITGKSCHIDHCHESNNVRGLLCQLCNKGLGQFKDNVQFLTNAIKYLNK